MNVIELRKVAIYITTALIIIVYLLSTQTTSFPRWIRNLSHNECECDVSDVSGDSTRRTELSGDAAVDATARTIRETWLHAPGTGFTGAVQDYSQHGQAVYVDTILNERRNGFFIECGAKRGVSISNTLYLELTRDWTGLLIEADKVEFSKLLSAKRKAYAINACLSATNQSGLYEWSRVRRITALRQTHIFSDARVEEATMMMQCFTFTSLMAALDVTHVDYFSLDVEGGEIPILKTIPWQHVRIDVIGVEYRLLKNNIRLVDEEGSERKLREIDDVILGTGLYRRIGVIPGGANMTSEIIRQGLDAFYQRIE